HVASLLDSSDDSSAVSSSPSVTGSGAFDNAVGCCCAPDGSSDGFSCGGEHAPIVMAVAIPSMAIPRRLYMVRSLSGVRHTTVRVVSGCGVRGDVFGTVEPQIERRQIRLQQ